MNMIINVILSLIGSGVLAIVKIIVFGSALIALILYIMKVEFSDIGEFYPIKPDTWEERFKKRVERIYDEQ